jgi:hypothetical protein
VRIVDCGMDRPIPRDLATDHGGERFAHVCLRKLFVLCARGGETEGPHACTLVIARHALPVLIGRCEAIIGSYVADDAADTVSDGRGGRVSLPRHRLEEMLCVLEVLETMTLDPRVSNWLAEGNDDFPGALLSQLLAVCSSPAAHLLSLCGSSAECPVESALGCSSTVRQQSTNFPLRRLRFLILTLSPSRNADARS